MRLALINKAKSKKTIFQKGFTLVELMVTVAIVGFLSAFAVPQFLNFQADAKGRSAFGEVIGLAKECATARSVLVDNLYPDPYPTSLKTANADGVKVVDQDCTKAVTTAVTFTSTRGGIKGIKCGPEVVTDANESCQIVVSPTGKQTFSLI